VPPVVTPTPGLPILSEAKPGTLGSCTDLAKQFSYANTTISSTTLVASGPIAGIASPASFPEHCLIKGEMNRRTSNVDGQSYAIGFEMRLPTAWNGRYFYQANGGVDGSIVTATGGTNLGGGPVSNALTKGFAVISSDAGHQPAAPFFGLDPQARLDYGYQAEATLTPMAKNLIKVAYGRLPDRSYYGGCSNGGRHTMVAATRYANDYDGFLAGNPGFHLPKSAIEQLWKVQQYARIATGTIASGADAGLPDITTAVTPAEFKLVGASVVAKCDTLDGVKDGIVSDVLACQSVFDIKRDVPTCAVGAVRDGSCLTDAQQNVLAKVAAGSSNSNGELNYAKFLFDPGIAGNDWARWHYNMSITRDNGAIAFIFNTPPMSRSAFDATTGLKYALAANIANMFANMYTTDSIYKESSWSFATPPDETNLKTLRNRGAKLMVFHGAADGVFSPADTVNWYDGLKTGTAAQTDEYARLFLVPGMNHCSGGPATDQFDMLDSLVNWVEKGQAPDQVIAKARGAGATVVNTELPATWSAARTRPLCPYPKVAKYNGTGDIESASSFTCK
jgi:feruloyl esterase